MLAKNLKKAREAAKLSVREAARRTIPVTVDKKGITAQYISQLEREKRTNPSLSILSDLATVYRVPISSLTG